MIDLTRRTLLTGTVASTAVAGISLAPGHQARAAPEGSARSWKPPVSASRTIITPQMNSTTATSHGRKLGPTPP